MTKKMQIRPMTEDGWIEVNDKDLVKYDEDTNTTITICDKNWQFNLRKTNEPRKDE